MNPFTHYLGTEKYNHVAAIMNLNHFRMSAIETGIVLICPIVHKIPLEYLEVEKPLFSL